MPEISTGHRHHFGEAMSKYTAEGIREFRKGNRAYHLKDVLEAFEDLLGEREAAKAGVTDGWPEYVMLRDTGLYDDAGGLGQRIYTTAGSGYKKRKYICAKCGAMHECSVCPECHGFGKQPATTDELRAKFEAWCLHRGINTEKRSNGHYLSDEVCFWWKLWSDAHASRDAEVEALRKRIEDAPVYYVPAQKPNDEDGWLQVIGSVKAINSMRGKHVRLVVDDELQESKK